MIAFKPIGSMRAKIRILLAVLVFICFVVIYIVGYGFGHKAAVRDETRFGILLYPSLYKLAEAGNTNDLQSKLRFLTFSASDYYDRYFSNEVDTNQSFLTHLAEARALASIERTQIVTFTPDSLVHQFNEQMR